jgi:F420-0:gamma-glutamyl ligase-like protein
MGHGAGETVWDMAKKFKVKPYEITWEMLEKVKHKPIIICRFEKK